MSQKISIRAWFLGSRLDIRELDRVRLLAHSPVIMKTGPDEWVVAFRFGVVVLFGHKIRQEEQMLKTLEGLVSGAFSHPESEEAELVIDADLKDTVNHEGHIVVIDKSPERLQIIAQILAKSVVLAHYEKAVASTFERFENLVEQLRDGLSPGKGRAVIHEVGNALAILTRTVGKVEVAEKPELTWDNPQLDKFYQRLAAEYELHDRDLILSRKLELPWRIAESYLDILNNRQGHRLEWYIIILIMIEIFLTLAEKLHVFS